MFVQIVAEVLKSDQLDQKDLEKYPMKTKKYIKPVLNNIFLKSNRNIDPKKR